MLSDRVNKALNDQMGKEFFAFYSYLATAAFFEEEELPGFANFFHLQAKEEVTHAMKLFDYIHKAGGKAAFEAMAAPKSSFATPLEPFEHGLESERRLAKEIDEIRDIAIAEKDVATRVFLQWFITEQVEEEALFHHCIKRMKRIGTEGPGLILLDREFGERRPGS